MTTLIECEPEVGKSYVAHYASAIHMVKVIDIFYLLPSGAKIVECLNLTTNRMVRMLGSHKNCAIFYRGQS